MMFEFDFVLLVVSIAVSYLVRRQVYLGPVDPLKLSALGEGVWVVTVYQLALQGVATPPQVLVFTICLLIWWLAWWLLGRRWGKSYRLSIMRFWKRIAEMPRTSATRLTVLYLVGLLTLLLVTLSSGGGGDNRLSIMKLLRPMESVTTLLVPVVLFRLLLAKSRRSKLLLVTILLAMIVTGGKSSILSLLVPVTGAALIGRIQLRPKTIAGLVMIALLGFFASVTTNYGVTNPLQVLSVLYTRMALDGDVYLLALPNDLLAQTSTTSLTTYLFGPFIKVLFLPIDVDQNIGAQIGSLLRDEDTANGPNPHWPIVLMAFHKGIVSIVVLSVLSFMVILWVKLRVVKHSESGHWPLWAAIPFTSYVLLYPQTFFADPSFPAIYFVQAGVLALLSSLLLRRWYPRHHVLTDPANRKASL